jgi:hypothetical protein
MAVKYATGSSRALLTFLPEASLFWVSSNRELVF